MKEQIANGGMIVLTTFIVSAIIMIFMKKIAVHVGALDVPTNEEGHRHIHKKVMPNSYW